MPDPEFEEPEEPASPDEMATQSDALGRALQAARELKPIEMVEALYESYVLDGLARWLQDTWPSFAPQDVEDIVAESVDVLYRKVDQGTPVGGVVSFMKKV